MTKSTVEEIRARFDHDVERFSNLDTGQSATMDAPLCMDLIARAAKAVTPGARSVLDIGCGAGNYTLKLLERIVGLNCTLVDLSRPMLDRAEARVRANTTGTVTAIQGDVRDLELGDDQYDIVLAAAVLHHLRGTDEWDAVFAKIYRSLRPSGSVWIFDLAIQDLPGLQELMWERYGMYLTEFRGESYRDAVFQYVEREDTPRSLLYQTDLLRSVGFSEVSVLHVNGPFAAFGGQKLAAA